jgi:hypothetical protein
MQVSEPECWHRVGTRVKVDKEEFLPLHIKESPPPYCSSSSSSLEYFQQDGNVVDTGKCLCVVYI